MGNEKVKREPSVVGDCVRRCAGTIHAWFREGSEQGLAQDDEFSERQDRGFGVYSIISIHLVWAITRTMER